MPSELVYFLREHEIPEEDFVETKISWDDLIAIKKDFRLLRKELNLIARYIEDKLQSLDAVHSVRCRVKDPDHLLAKIIRKQIQYPNRTVTVDNYRSYITDLIGIRAIHLFKEDWIHIHQFITDTWNLYEQPTAYIRHGETGQHIEDYKAHHFDIREHHYGYKSIHYLVESKPSRDLHLAEIQVRTIFEEGWSEIDHTIKYPKNVTDPLLDTFLDNFNILAGNSDQMGSFVRNLKEDLVRGTAKLEMYEKLTEKHTGIIHDLKRRVAGTKGELTTKIRMVEEKLEELESQLDGEFDKVFRREIDEVRKKAADFDQALSQDPQIATELFESSINQLGRIDIALDIMLNNNEIKPRAVDDDILVLSYKEWAVQFLQHMETTLSLDKTLKPVFIKNLPTDEASLDIIAKAVHAISGRDRFTKFIVGQNYQAISMLCKEVRANKKRIESLKQHCRQVEEPVVRHVLNAQILLFTEQNNRLEDFVVRYNTGISLFGWLSKLMVRR